MTTDLDEVYQRLHRFGPEYGGDEEGNNGLTNLAHGLAFWAARYRPITGVTEPSGSLDPGPALTTVARLAERSGLIADRLNRLEHEAGWPDSLRALRPAASPDDVIERLDDIIAAAVSNYARYGHAAPVLLVHTATAPNAMRHVLPALPHALWRPSLTAAWTVSAAVMAAYAPPQPIAAPALDALDPADALARAAAHGDEHVLKFTDTASKPTTAPATRNCSPPPSTPVNSSNPPDRPDPPGRITRRPGYRLYAPFEPDAAVIVPSTSSDDFVRYSIFYTDDTRAGRRRGGRSRKMSVFAYFKLTKVDSSSPAGDCPDVDALIKIPSKSSS